MALLKLTGQKVPVPSLPHRSATAIIFNHVPRREATTQPSRRGEYGPGSLLHLVSIVMHCCGYLDLQIVYL